MHGTRGSTNSGKAWTKQGSNTLVLCGCGCKARLSRAQRARHMRGLSLRFVAASSSYMRSEDLHYIRTGQTSGTIATLILPAWLTLV